MLLNQGKMSLKKTQRVYKKKKKLLLRLDVVACIDYDKRE